jgi:glycosyltransferase involved in cell wall biosynthesis
MEKQAVTPLVSVLLPVFNGMPFLEQAVKSILGQTFSNFEFIVVDDGSTDETYRLLQSIHDPRVIILRNRTNRGIVCCLNQALVKARGEYLARQDADDISLPRRLELQVGYLEDHPEVGVLGTSFGRIDERGNVYERVYAPTKDWELRLNLLDSSTFLHANVMMRRGLIEKLGGYQEGFPYAEDYELWIRVAEITKLANLPTLLYQCRYRPISISRSYREEQVETIKRIQKEVWNKESSLLETVELREVFRVTPGLRLKQVFIPRQKVLLRIAYQLYRRGDRKRITKLAWLSWLCWPLTRWGWMALALWFYTILPFRLKGIDHLIELGKFRVDVEPKNDKLPP